MPIPKSILFAVSVPLGLTGCASTNPAAPFRDVDQTVGARLGAHLQWAGAGKAVSDQSIKASVAGLLHGDLTVQSATAIALLNNRSLQAEFEEIGISQAELAQASRLRNPEIAGSARFPDRPPSATDAEFSIAGDFLDLLTLPARRQIAAANLEATKLTVADQVLRLAAKTQTAFYTLQAQLQLNDRLGVIVALNDAAADFARRQYQAGNITDLDLHNQQVAAAQSHFDLMQAQAQMQADREQLNRVLGLSEGQLEWRIAAQLPPLPPDDPPLAELESLAATQRLDLAAKRREMKSLAAVLRLKQRTRYLPGATVGADTERTPDGQRVIGPTLRLELPLFDQGQPAIAKLTAEYRQAQDRYLARQAVVGSEVRAALATLVAARTAADFAGQVLLPLRRKILGETLLHYDAMEKSVYALLLAKEREQAAEEASVAAQRDYWVARVALERAVGGRLAVLSNQPPQDPPRPQPEP